MKISVQTGNVVNDLGPQEGYRLLRACGFEAVDWNIDKALPAKEIRAGHIGGCIFERPLPEILDYYQQELSCMCENGLTITQAHAPFPAHVKGFPEVEEYVIGLYKGCIQLCGEVGCKNLIVHGISCSPNEPGLSAEEVDKKNFHLYESLIPSLQKTDVTVCLENLFTTVDGCRYEGTCSDPHEAVRLIDTLNEKAGRECFGLCMDTGHLQLLRKNLREYVYILGPRIKALHIHDNDSVSDQHLMPFAGTVRWNEFTDAMREIGYRGDLSFETFNQTNRSRMDPAYIPVFLRAIHGIGEIFRERIEGPAAQ